MSNHEKQSNSPDKIDRRKFIEVAAVTAGVMFIKPGLVRGTAANSAIRVGLLGCGGRGTEDADQPRRHRRRSRCSAGPIISGST